MYERREKGSDDGFIMDPCLVSPLAAGYHGYKVVKHEVLRDTESRKLICFDIKACFNQHYQL